MSFFLELLEAEATLGATTTATPMALTVHVLLS
jgi:hypothetical protein